MNIFKLFMLSTFLLLSHTAFAQSVAGCGAGNQDSACVIKLSKAPEVPPTCPTGPGYPASPAPVWEGSYYSANCSAYQPPPTCGGETETVAPTWNGVTWVGLGCAPALPPGFTLAPDGNPYAMLIGYCGEVSEVTILHVAHWTFSCTPSMSGASRVNQSGTIVNGNGTLDYWNTPSSFTTAVVSAATNGTYANAPGPAGTVVQTVNILFGSIVWEPGDSPTGSDYLEGSAGSGSNEGWVFACPSTYPTINFTTVAAYGESNPTLIECAP